LFWVIYRFSISLLSPLKSTVSGKTPADWRKAAYYHYYEYPAEHSVKRHYGIRTQDFKLKSTFMLMALLVLPALMAFG